MQSFRDRRIDRRVPPSGDASAESSIETVRRLPSARRSVGYLTGGSLFTTFLMAVGGVLIGRLVEPSTLGFFNGISLALTYTSFLGLGVVSGLSRELPFFVGKGERGHAEKLAAAAQAWTFVVGAAVATGMLAVAGWYLVEGDMWKTAGWFTNAIVAVQLFYSEYLQMTYRTGHDFGRLALVKSVQQVAMVSLIVLVIPLDFYGLCLRVVIAGALTTALLFHWRPVKVGPKWNSLDLKGLLRIGLPIFVVWKVFDYWEVINLTVVLNLDGTYSLGLYAVVVMVAGAIQVLPRAMGQVLYPRMTERFGTGQSLREVARGYRKPMLVTAAAVLPLVLIAWWLVAPLTHLLIPRYADAVPAAQWALPMGLIGCFESVYALFTLARRQGMRLVGIIMGMAAYAGSLLWLIRDGVYLAAFSQAMLVGRGLCVLVSYALIYRILEREEVGKG